MIAYLDAIDSSVTEVSTVLEILCSALAIKDKFDLSSIVITLDQAIYAKLIDITQKEQGNSRASFYFLEDSILY